MRRGRGDRGRDCAGHRRRVHRVAGEVTHGAARREHIGGAVPEHVLGCRPDQRLGAGPVRLGDQVREAPDHGDGDPGRLPLDQVGSAGEFVGHRGDRDLQGYAERVRRAAIVPQRGHAGRADRRVRLPGAPRAPQRIRDHYPESDAEAVHERLAQPARGPVRILGQQHHRARRRVGGVHARRREHKTVPGLHDPGRPTAGDHAHRFRVDGLLPVHPGHPALRLADDLGGDHQDVPVGQAGGRLRDQPRQVRPLGDLGDPLDRDNSERHLIAPARASAATVRHERRSHHFLW